ncbi:SPJ_0845 family protein [Lacticaseibacillus pabuli]|uniref:SPJ_0845 family protein n=1 Tax=Lacticaseibacillus pabuli TaxID=3025672 RepID=A0ABY7WPA0_9LACO|nr:SPJ_0845 family protein [Lacticaseibacillus sp. KACC 23028]WDF81619.1 SPJ_0845 family protein [Lacticaseibacillus sp. KACC 23028]
MGLKVNRQLDMDKLFDQFATIPEGKIDPKDIDTKKAEKETARQQAYDRIDSKKDKK